MVAMLASEAGQYQSMQYLAIGVSYSYLVHAFLCLEPVVLYGGGSRIHVRRLHEQGRVRGMLRVDTRRRGLSMNLRL